MKSKTLFLNTDCRLPVFDYKQIKSENKKCAVSYLDSLMKYGIKPGLERIKLLCEELGNPQNTYPVIQVTGTNGKSSVAKMTEAILSANSFKTGAYISPHLFNHTERYSINGKSIKENDFYKLIIAIKEKAVEVDKRTRDPLTNFEILTAAGFVYFADKKVDAAVLEVGMGGRFDATSLSSPLVCVITNVDLDHTNFLGNTIEDIAKEKALIIKKGTNVIAGKINEDAMKVIASRVSEVNAHLFKEGKDFSINNLKKLKNGCYMADIDGILCKYENLLLSIPGKYQLDNLSVAIAASEKFFDKPLEKETLNGAVSNINLCGRIQTINYNPRIIIDVSHNPAGIKKLCQTLSEDFFYEKLITIVAVYKDKDYKNIYKFLDKISDKMYLTSNNHERCLNVYDLEGSKKKDNIYIEPSIEKAIDLAIKDAGQNDLICITGSFSTASLAGRYLSRINR